ncbi:hypothetical protein BT63DRAFT_425222 [Microthyrium microscopicum]|uniref:Peripheral subunit-binding (PSBD) domain-containing protein n=1 Tax=Microthyrium microscopicum TaxID=703497 RepID=A0A6A6UB89_9PEZI|nr:hypothetical protein BT63DRAFT_425222 [Microthyrium microscopicum]
MASRSSTRLITRLLRKPTTTLQSRTYSSSSSTERPLYPSVQVLLHTHNLSASDIKATGPQGRLLKGDVLAHLGEVKEDYPKESASRISSLSHLDLSNITPAAPKAAEALKKEAAPEPVEEIYEVSLPIDLKPVLKFQQRMQDSLGQAPALSELITRAINLANLDLPAPARAPTADELFDELVGQSSHGAVLADGRFIPIINNTGPAPSTAQPVDIFDELLSTAPSKKRAIVPRSLPSANEGAVNDFSIAASVEDRKRASVFLQRMKSVLEVEPGRLVL